MSSESLEEKQENVPRGKISLKEIDELDPSLQAIFEQVKSENELGLHRIEFLEKKSLDLMAFAGIILTITSYCFWGLRDKITLDNIFMPLIFLVFSIVSNLLAVMPRMIHGGPTACQLDELDSWKDEGTFEKTQLYKRWIEEYGRDSVKNGKLGLERSSSHNIAMSYFLVGLISFLLIFFDIKIPWYIQIILFFIVFLAIVWYNSGYYDRQIENLDDRERRFNELIGSEKWKKLGSRHDKQS